jgi:hypothetical protein
LGIRGDFFDLRFSYIAGIVFFEVLYAILNVVGSTLSEHLDKAIRQVSDKTGKLVPVRRPVSGEAKTDALDPADENDVSGNHFLTNYSSFLNHHRLTRQW